MKRRQTRAQRSRPPGTRAKAGNSPRTTTPDLPLAQAPPPSFELGSDINWKARWFKVTLRVELPFWLMVDNVRLVVTVGGHPFPVFLHGETFELHAGEVSDSKQYVLYSGPRKLENELSSQIRTLRQKRPELPFEWRKCKTVVRIVSRCNADVWKKRPNVNAAPRPSVKTYFEELCRAHIPVLNELIQKYRQATYDAFAFEVSPWDVPYWHIARGEEMLRCTLVPYRLWDHVPIIYTRDKKPRFYRIIDPKALRKSLSSEPTAGELELLDAMNFMQRGNYSDAVRRITTAIEAVVGARLRTLIGNREGLEAAERYLNQTRMRFDQRVKKYEELVGRGLGETRRQGLATTRGLRNRIVHLGYRIPPAERFVAERCVDTGRWIFNWFEDNENRRKIRESRVAFRGLGRDALAGVYRPEISAKGVVLYPLSERGPVPQGNP